MLIQQAIDSDRIREEHVRFALVFFCLCVGRCVCFFFRPQTICIE